MSQKKSATGPQPASVEVPVFCVGPPGPLRRRLPKLGADWAAHYRAAGAFPEPELVPAGDGTLVFTEPNADLSGRPGVRIYVVPELLNAVQAALGWADAEAVRAAFEAAVRDRCWGALALAVTNRRPPSVAGLRTRVDALLGCWDALDQLRYVDFHPDPITLAALVQRRFEGLLTMWLPQPAGDTRRDLQAALDALAAADAEARVSRAVARLAQLAAASKRIRSKDALTDPGTLRREFARLGPQEREAIEAGSTGDALTLLIGTDRALSGQ